MKKGLLALAAACAMATSASAATTDNPFAQDKATLHLTGLDLLDREGSSALPSAWTRPHAVCGDRRRA